MFKKCLNIGIDENELVLPTDPLLTSGQYDYVFVLP